jgi:hypothetical protein
MITKEMSLDQYRRTENSQHGEDGILERIFEVLEISKGWCAELGAWDGIRYSNTHYLIKNKGWSAVLIEANPQRFQELTKNYHLRSDVHCFQKFIGFDSHNSLDYVFAQTPIPKNFDLLSIDIDGNDYHLWESLNNYQPKVIIIEHNPTIPNAVSFIQPRNMSINQGSSLLALVELGKKKGYELIAVTETNGIFVLKEFFHLFHIPDNSLSKLRPYSPVETYLFQLYDGTLGIAGNKKLLWSGININEKKLQILPKSLRFYQTENPVKKILRKLWRYLNIPK